MILRHALTIAGNDMGFSVYHFLWVLIGEIGS
jgi:hypothetical protein